MGRGREEFSYLRRLDTFRRVQEARCDGCRSVLGFLDRVP